MKPDYLKRYKKIRSKWTKFKRLRCLNHDEVGHPDFLTMMAREAMFEELLNIIEYGND